MTATASVADDLHAFLTSGDEAAGRRLQALAGTVCRCGLAASYHGPRLSNPVSHEYEPRYDAVSFAYGLLRGRVEQVVLSDGTVAGGRSTYQRMAVAMQRAAEKRTTGRVSVTWEDASSLLFELRKEGFIVVEGPKE